jgi:hypothetical protein
MQIQNSSVILVITYINIDMILIDIDLYHPKGVKWLKFNPAWILVLLLKLHLSHMLKIILY